MVIEYLRFDVPPDLRAAFLAADAAIWTASLSRYPGFIDKETWLDQATGQVVTLLRWQTLEAWKSIPQSDLDEIDARMGELRMPIVESRAFLPVNT